MRPEKQFLLDDVKNSIANSKALVLASYKRLEPNTAAKFRMKLAENGSSLTVVKKRVLAKAAEAAGVALDPQILHGHVAIVFAYQDPVATTKIVYQFCQENEEILEVLGGRFEGSLCSASDVEQISKLPGRDEMRAQFLGTLEAPLSQTLAVFEALLTSVAYCLENKSQNSS